MTCFCQAQVILISINQQRKKKRSVAAAVFEAWREI